MGKPLFRPAMTTLLVLAGCHSVYFYETDKISLTIEARPDATGPIQGNFGLKQRVVAFVPPTKAATETATRPATRPTTQSTTQPVDLDEFRTARAIAADRHGDAMSVLSSMRFHKWPKPEGAPWYNVSHMSIDAALITGAAAKVAANPGQAIGTLSGEISSSGSLVGLAALDTIYRTLNSRKGSDAQAAEIVQRLKDMTLALPKEYPVSIYDWDQSGTNLHKMKNRHDPITANDFPNVITYWSQLEQSAKVLTEALGQSAPLTVDNVTINGSARTDLEHELATTKELRDAFRKAIASSPAVRQALDHFRAAF
jgi:hypothetical protein